MKHFIFLIAILFLSCGQEQQCNVDISGTTVVWQGQLDSDPWMLQVFDGTNSCLSNFGFSAHNGYPEVIITEHGFNVDGIYTNGYTCFNESKIYIVNDFSCNSSVLATFYEPNCWLLRHEIIHWITGTGDNAHDTEYMNQCAMSPFN